MTDKLHVALNDDLIACDVAAFEAARKQGQFARAVSLYGGPLLEGYLDEAIVEERERLQAMYVTMADELLRKARSERDDDRAFELASLIHAVDPWREDVVRALMELRARSGDRAGALSFYERFAQRLTDDMGVAPMPETAALRDELRALGVSLPPQEAVPTVELRFSGRSREMETLLNAAERARGGRGCVVFVCGEAGIGKSRLVSEFAREMAQRRWRIATGTTSHGGERRPYQPLAEALSSLSGTLGELDDVQRALVDTLLGSSISDEETHDPRLVFDAIAAAFAASLASAPLVVVCEDMHDAEERTLDALLFSARRLANSPALIVVTYRSDEVGPADAVARRQRELLASGTADLVPLSRLARSSVEESLRDVAIANVAAPTLASEAFRLSEGVPLVLQQVVQNWAESRGASLQGTGGALGDVISSRIDRLSADARAFAEVAAVAGEAFDPEVVRAASGFDAAPAFRALDELLERRLIRESGARGAFRITFAHNLIRAHVYEALPPNVRDRLHRRIGGILLSLGDAVAADAAAHFDACGDFERAAPLLLLAARQFRMRAAYERAAVLAAHGLTLARDALLRFDLLLEAEGVADLQGDRSRQGDLLLQAAEMLEEVDETRAGTFLTRRARLARVLGDSDAKKEAVAALGALSERSANTVVRANALFERGRMLYDQGDTAGGRADFESALALFETAGDVQGVVDALSRMVETEVTTGTILEAEALVRRLRAISADADDVDLRRRVEASAFMVALRRRDYDEAIRAGEILLQHGQNRDRIAYIHSRLAVAFANSARWREAQVHYARARRLYRELEDLTGLAVTALNEGSGSAKFGHLSKARALFAEADERFAEVGDHFGTTMAKTNRANVALHLGRYAEASRCAREAIDAAQLAGSAWLQSVALGNLAVAEREQGDIEAALAHGKNGIALARSSGSPAQVMVDLAEYGITLCRAGRLEEALSVATEVGVLSDTYAPESLPFVPAYARAVVASAAGRADAKALLRAAREALDGYLSSLDQEGRAEMVTSAFVRPVLAATATPDGERTGSS
ncbi:MAG: AAA family ATPase [Candidatus Eremiobacteraeota bacterium]|nr:AAA family ATPase [Candidatus Eremiobacteraeota bacterium]